MAILAMARGNYANKIIDLGPQVIPRGEKMKDKELRLFFQKHDRNGDGVLDKNELTAAFRRLGSAQPARVASWGLHFFDRNGDGGIGISEKEVDRLTKYALLFGYRVR